tara:strand:- start:1283 stop:1639 length:357 start_codon:yes stop_codon:yes gene_type:complete
MKKSTKVTQPAANGSQAPGIYVNTADGQQAGIINLHSSIRQFWDKIIPSSLEAMQDDLFLTTHQKGVTICKKGAGGKVVHLGWVNGAEDGKAVFLEKFGTEALRFSVPVDAADMGDLI